MFSHQKPLGISCFNPSCVLPVQSVWQTIWRSTRNNCCPSNCKYLTKLINYIKAIIQEHLMCNFNDCQVYLPCFQVTNELFVISFKLVRPDYFNNNSSLFTILSCPFILNPCSVLLWIPLKRPNTSIKGVIKLAITFPINTGNQKKLELCCSENCQTAKLPNVRLVTKFAGNFRAFFFK